MTESDDEAGHAAPLAAPRMVPQLNVERTPVTLLLSVTMVALEVLAQLDPGTVPMTGARQRFYENGLGISLGIWNWPALLTSTPWEWTIWQPLTTTLLHGSLLHAFFNIYILALLGAVLENWLGWRRMLGLVVYLAFVSTLPQYVWSNDTTNPWHGQRPISLSAIVGFSGVNYGLFGLIWMGRRYRSDFALACPREFVNQMLGWLVLCIFLTHFNVLPVANVAHGAGLLFGVLIGLTAFRPRERWQWGLPLAVLTVLDLGILIVPGLYLHGSLAQLIGR